MAELFSIDVYYAVKELQSFIGAKIEKAYQGERHDILLHLYCADGKKRNIRFLPGVICTPQEKPEYPMTPPGFAMFLRKRICGSRITAIEQLQSDRVIQFTCEYKDSPKLLLVFELMTPGNIILTDESYMIINLLEQRQYKDRALRARSLYSLPPAPYPATIVSPEDLAKHILASNKESVVKTLAIHCGFGGTYAEEVCARAGIAKHRNDLTSEEALKLAETFQELLHLPVFPTTDDQRAYPIKMESKECEPASSTFLDAITKFTSSTGPEQSGKQGSAAAKSAPKSKLDRLIDAQSAQLASLESAAAEDQRKAEWIYEHYSEVSALLDIVRSARERKDKVHDAIAHLKKISYNEKTAEITIDTGDDGIKVSEAGR